MVKKKVNYRARRKLQQRIVLGIVALVLSLGLIGSSIVWTMGRSPIAPDDYAQETAPKITDLEKKAGDNPGDAQAWITLADAYMDQDQAVKAEEAYKKALEISPGREDVSNSLAWCYIKLQQYDRAEEVLKGVIQKSPENIDAHYGYGYALLGMSRFDEAAREFESFLKSAGSEDRRIEQVRDLLENIRLIEQKKQ